MQGRISISALRKLELDDLLGRDPVQLDDENLHHCSWIGSYWLPAPEARSGASFAARSPVQAKAAVLVEIGEFSCIGSNRNFVSVIPLSPSPVLSVM